MMSYAGPTSGRRFPGDRRHTEEATSMATKRSDLQREQSKINGAKSKGPADRSKVRFNGLKHGLRAEQVVLPGEDPAAFEAEKQAFFDDWQPRSHTRAVLVERAALASWRLRRCARVEAARLRKLAAKAARAFDGANEILEARARERFEDDAAGGAALLIDNPFGLDRLIFWWGELEAILARGPECWDLRQHHNQMMALLGLDDEAEAAETEYAPAVAASLRLLAAVDPEEAPPGTAPFPPREAKQAAEALRSLFAEEVAGLEARRSRLTPTATLRRRAIDEALVDDSPEARLLHRYEMAHDRVLRASIKELIALDKSGADLAEAEDVGDSVPEAGPGLSVASPTPEAPSEPEVVVAAAPSEPKPGSSGMPDAPVVPMIAVDPAPSGKADRDRDGRTWPVESAGGPELSS
jgi:hypothetical protein